LGAIPKEEKRREKKKKEARRKENGKEGRGCPTLEEDGVVVSTAHFVHVLGDNHWLALGVVVSESQFSVGIAPESPQISVSCTIKKRKEEERERKEKEGE